MEVTLFEKCKTHQHFKHEREIYLHAFILFGRIFFPQNNFATFFLRFFLAY